MLLLKYMKIFFIIIFFVLYNLNFMKFFIFSEMIFSMIFFFYFMLMNMNIMLMCLMFTGFMILESCMCIIMFMENNYSKKMFFLNNCFLY